MKKFIVLVFLFGFSVFAYSQKVNIDFILNKDPVKIEYRIQDIFNGINKLREGKNTYLQFKLIESVSQGNSPYICEIWEYGEILKSSIFRDVRYITKYDEVAKKDVKQSYIAAGIKVKAASKFYVRIYERESNEILDVFVIDANNIQEIADDEVKSKYKPNQNNKLLEDAKLIEYESKIMKIRKDIFTYFVEDINNNLNHAFSFLVPPPKLKGIHEKKDEKVKEIVFEQYFEKLVDYGFSYCDLNFETELLGRKIYQKIGTSYFRPEDAKLDKSSINILGIWKGQKELSSYIGKSNIYILEHPETDEYLLGEYKGERKHFDFFFFFEPLSYYEKYSKEQRKSFEFAIQSHFLKSRDIRPIVNSTLTASINKSQLEDFENSNEESNPEIKIEDIKGNNLMFITVPGMIKEKKDVFKITKGPVDEKKRFYVYPVFDYTEGENNIKESGEITYVNEADKLEIEEIKIDLEKIDPLIFKINMNILGVTKIDGEKDDFIMIESNYKINDLDDVKIYVTDKSDKKRKSISSLKLEQIINPYLGIYEIKSGEKEILNAININKKLYIESDIYEGLFGVIPNPFKSSLKWNILCKNCKTL